MSEGRIQVGQWIVNNDPRNKGQTVKVEAVVKRLDRRNGTEAWYASYTSDARRAYIRVDRIYDAHYSGHSGWRLTSAPSMELKQAA